MHKISKKDIGRIDLFFIILIVLSYAFSCFLYFTSNKTSAMPTSEEILYIVQMNLLYLFIIFAYLLSTTACLICCLLYVFGFASYILYQIVVAHQIVPTNSYFWLLWIPLTCVAVSLYHTYIAGIQKQIVEIEENKANLVAFDETTNQLNEKMFFHDMNSFMAMEKRGYIKITLMMIQLRYHSDLHRILGDEGLKKLYKQIGDSINSATRTEDSSYFLDDGSYLLVTISDKNGGSDIVKERLRSAVQQISISSEYQKYDLAVNIRIGIAEDDENCHNVMDLLQRARKDMECDV